MRLSHVQCGGDDDVPVAPNLAAATHTAPAFIASFKLLTVIISLAACLFASAFLLLASPTPAYAYSPQYVASLASVDSGEVFLTNLSTSNMTVSTSSNFASTSGRNHYDTERTIVADYYAKPTIGANTTLGSASAPCITAKWSNAGRTSSGDPVDFVLRIRQILFPRAITTSYNRMFMLTDIGTIWLGSGGGPFVSGGDAYGVNMTCDMYVYYAGTSNLVNKRTQFAVKDLDIMGYGSSYANEYAEGIQLISGFDNTTYVQSDTLLNRSLISSSGGAQYRGTVNDNASWKSGFVAYFSSGTATFSYRACNYAATEIIGVYTSYPAWLTPSKTVNGNSATDRLDDCYEDSVTFTSTQFLPYTATSNKASSIMFSDTLDSSLDATGATVKVFRNNSDVTSEWDITRSGQTITATAKNTATACGEHKLVITTKVRIDADLSTYGRTTDGYYIIPNVASTTINGTTKASNRASVEVMPYAVFMPSSSSLVPDMTDGNANYNLGGTRYAVYVGMECTQLVGTVEINDEGEVVGGLQLPFGDYFVRQEVPGAGYRTDVEVRKLAVNFATTAAANGTRTISPNYPQDPMRGTISLSQLHAQDCDYKNTSGSYGLNATYIIETESGQRFECSMNENGDADDIEVPLGRVIVKETGTASGYVITNDTREATIEHDGQRVELALNDVPVVGKISISCISEYENETIRPQGTVVQIMAAEDIYNNQGSIVAHYGDVVEELTVDENGTATSTNLFYLGRYETKIKSCPTHLEYEADSTYPIVLSYQGQDVPIVSAHAEIPLHNIVQMPETGQSDIAWRWIVMSMVLIGSALGTMYVYARRPSKK